MTSLSKDVIVKLLCLYRKNLEHYHTIAQKIAQKMPQMYHKYTTKYHKYTTKVLQSSTKM